MNTTLEQDIIIVGAGMVGCALACQLIKDNPGLRITILEAVPFRPLYDVTHFDSRVVAISAASQTFLNSLNIWSAIANKRYCAYTHMEVWDGRGTARIHFDCREVGESALGYIVENSIIIEALLQQLRQTSVNIRCPAVVTAINMPSDHEPALVILEDGSSLQSQLIIATDGAQSKVRELAHLQTREWDYGHTAIVCTVRSEHSHHHVARQVFTTQGPLAFLPLQDNNGDTHHCSIVWSATTDYAKYLLALNESDFASVLAKTFEYQLGKIVHVTPRHHFPLQQRHCKDYFKPGVVVAGDAAHTIHPLAGQGVNLGLQDAIVLADEILRATQRNIPLSDTSILKRYQRRRKGPNLAMMSAMEGFKQLFSQDPLPMHWLRNEGMRRVAQIPFVKRQLIRKAMGL